MHSHLSLRLTPSPTLLLVGCAAHLVLLGVCYFGIESTWIGTGCGVAIVVSLIGFLSDEQRKRGRILMLDDAGLVALGDPSSSLAAQPIKHLTDYRWVVWLSWQAPASAARPGRTTSLMLLPDHLAGEEWRALKIWLRHHAMFVSRDELDAP